MLRNKSFEQTLWVIVHANSQKYFGRFDGRWTRTYELDAAALWHTLGVADNAHQALRAEASDRVRGSKEIGADEMWWDIHGGATEVREVRQVTSVVER